MISTDHVLHVWKDQKQLAPDLIKSHKWFSVALSRDGKFAATAAIGGQVAIWNLDVKPLSPQLLRMPKVRGIALNGGLCVAISADNRHLATSSPTNSIWIWHLDNRDQPPLERRGHDDVVTALIFTSSGQQLISGSRDGTVRSWSMTGEFDESIEVVRHERGITKLALSPKSDQAAWLGEDGTVVVSQLSTHYLAKLVEQKVWRNLTQQEWERYVGKDYPYEATIPAWGKEKQPDN
jgi:WD40 repeat protein